MVCRTWSQPDGNHLRGLCTNELFSESGGIGCSICINPIDRRTPGECDCPLPHSPRSVHYLRITTVGAYTPTYAPNTCWFDFMLGDFVLTGYCSGRSAEKQVISHATLGAPVPVPPCELTPFASSRWSFGVTFVTTIGGRKFAGVQVKCFYGIAGYQGPPPYPIYTYGLNPFTLNGLLPWCDNNRGAAVLTQESHGILGPTITGFLSTEPFT